MMGRMGSWGVGWFIRGVVVSWGGEMATAGDGKLEAVNVEAVLKNCTNYDII